MKDKRVWITGASSGIGEALAIAFAQKGAHLILSSRNKAELHRVSALCKGAASVMVCPLDLEKYHTLAEIAKNVLKQVGKVDILINNGGVSQRAFAMETSLEVDKKLMDINYFGTVALTKAIIPNMLMHQLGHIVTITSLTGKFGTKYRSSYAASKHALHGFFDSLRAELSDTPLKITLVCPGYIRTKVSINALIGSGAAQNSMDPSTDKGMDPSDLAEKIISAIQQEKREVYFGGKEVFAVYLKRFFPSILANMLNKNNAR